MDRLFLFRCSGLFLVILTFTPVTWGVNWSELRVADVVYRDAVALRQTASSLTIRHRDGITQVPMVSLSEHDKQRVGYDAAAAEAYQAELDRKRSLRARQQMLKKEAAGPKVKRGGYSQRRLMGLFGTNPDLKELVDMRSEFNELQIGVRNQGRRPSCAVFSLIGALEYQNAKKRGRSEAFSEEYLIWATHKVLGRYNQTRGKVGAESKLDVDAGFRLAEVAQALRSYGVPRRADMPYKVTGEFMMKSGPPESVIEKAKKRNRVTFSSMPGRDGRTRIQNVVHALNESTPVVIGVAWPTARAIAKSPTLSKQKPRSGYAHAVTLVGYKCPTGKIEETTFIFRNSWGRSWGAGGYGFARYEYLEKHMFEAIALDLSS